MSNSTKPAPKLARRHALDELIMETNSSSIVSKRSVEKLYYPNEAHYFRYFVNKYQRRAPLINRGYWLRLKAIDVVVRRFLTKHQGHKKKLIINLGCGSDVLPWQSHARYTDLCEDVLFVDVDYPELMRKKRSIVQDTPQLREILGTDFVINDSDEDPVMIRSKIYCQIGCDLRDLDKIGVILDDLTSSSGCPVLFVAEVSITYMDTHYADALIQWASKIRNSEFCLLEQLLPYGPDHPFARTMLSHFDKLKTPLKSVAQYSTLSKQIDRFTSRGFKEANIWDLWQAWSSEEFVSSAERTALNEVEPFDEWEDFMLFGRHYFILHASTSPEYGNKVLQIRGDPIRQLSNIQCSVVTKYVQGSKRRFGDTFAISNTTGGRLALNLFGLVPGGREESYDVYSLDEQNDIPSLPIKGPISRMCHTITDMGDYGILLVGGRSSPANALSDCWIFEKGSCLQWKPTHTLPVPLFRHSIIRLRGTHLALIAGGKTGPSDISEDFYVFHPSNGWLKCKKEGVIPQPTFGGILCNSPSSVSDNGVHSGLIAGGLDLQGRINQRVYLWHLDFNTAQPLIRFEICGRETDPTKQLSLFGAKSIDFGPCTLVCGGVGERQDADGHTIIAIDMISQGSYAASKLCRRSNDEVMPLMIGSSMLRVDDDIVVLGGGATCFSMGTCWHGGASTISIYNKPTKWAKTWPSAGYCSLQPRFIGSRKFLGSNHRSLQRKGSNVAEASVTTIARKKLETRQQFRDILQNAVPVVIEEAAFGDCVKKWTASYLIDRVGHDTPVVIHECQADSGNMDFNAKNFCYVTQSFDNVIRGAEAGHRVYLRALSREQPTDRPANLKDDFPGLASDFHLPDQMESIQDSLFSSVLRVSGRVNMWLHYDVMANIYAQVGGSKRLVLFPPSDVKSLAFAPGASSSSLDVFSELTSSRMKGTHPHEAILNPGDMLYLPPLWLHAAETVTCPSIAVNVFFRNLNSGYTSGRDVYGNRDLAAYEKGRLDVERIGKSFQKLPLETRRFYLIRLADELELAAEGA
ncbi:hypothetical protein E4U42_002604 [Claviceps africana]|uniref:tRNA wybutosine-synthesizing protein 4 n=1 Tax=Claviceps africana TaxID=83212 RepID=A0A8K0JDY9_9HYPO|nr:hypothetical protein E4U42_002604 [Claviceps africana]